METAVPVWGCVGEEYKTRADQHKTTDHLQMKLYQRCEAAHECVMIIKAMDQFRFREQ